MRAICLCVCVCMGWCACMYVCVGACTETCERVCVCVQVCACRRLYECRVFVFQCVSFTLFCMTSMCSNVLLCYWFLGKYLCVPHFSLIKRQSSLSHATCTINFILLLISVIMITSWLKHQAEFAISVCDATVRISVEPGQSVRWVGSTPHPHLFSLF